jgi:ATP-dependent Clp protease adapter protein ClpS
LTRSANLVLCSIMALRRSARIANHTKDVPAEKKDVSEEKKCASEANDIQLLKDLVNTHANDIQLLKDLVNIHIRATFQLAVHLGGRAYCVVYDEFKEESLKK